MLATNRPTKKLIPQKQWLNVDSYRAKFKPSILCDVPATETIEYLREIELIRVYQSGETLWLM